MGFKVSKDAFFATNEPPFVQNNKIFIRTGDPDHPFKSFLWWTYEWYTKQTLEPNTRLKRYNKDPYDYYYENIYLPWSPEDSIPNETELTEKMVTHLLPYLETMDDVAPPSTFRNVDAPSSNILGIIDLVTELRWGLQSLSQSEQDLLSAIYIEDSKVKDVATNYNTSSQNISIKVNKVVNKLAKCMNQKYKWHVLIAEMKQFGF